jgi:hypothetical protein
MVAIAPEEVSAHSPQFASAAASEAGTQGLLDGAKALAMTVVDLVAKPEIMTKIKEEFGQEKCRKKSLQLFQVPGLT